MCIYMLTHIHIYENKQTYTPICLKKNVFFGHAPGLMRRNHIADIRAPLPGARETEGHRDKKPHSFSAFLYKAEAVYRV